MRDEIEEDKDSSACTKGHMDATFLNAKTLAHGSLAVEHVESLLSFEKVTGTTHIVSFILLVGILEHQRLLVDNSRPRAFNRCRSFRCSWLEQTNSLEERLLTLTLVCWFLWPNRTTWSWSESLLTRESLTRYRKRVHLFVQIQFDGIYLWQGRNIFVNLLDISQIALLFSIWSRGLCIGLALHSVLQLLQEIGHAPLTVDLGRLTLEV